MTLNSAPVKAKALELGFDTVGVCDAVSPPHLDAYREWLSKGRHGTMSYLEKQLPLKGSPQSLLPGASSVIAVGLNYSQPNPQALGQPRIAKYALGRDYHKVLRGKLRSLSRWMEQQYPEIRTRACVDSAPIMERDFAQLAGLGWFGKNTMLIDSRRGSWFFIGLLLSTARFHTDAPAVGSCGKCKACVDACPTGAIVFEEGRWQVDARRCVSYLTIEHRGAISPEFNSAVGDWTFGCDICQEVCPFNGERRSQPDRSSTTGETDFLRRRDWPSLRQLSSISREEWDLQTRGSAVRRAGWEGLKRNAALNISHQDDRSASREP